MSTSFSFPQYRRLVNGRSYYKVIDKTHMEEIQIMGKFWIRYELTANILPERVLIDDVLSLHDKRWEEITEAQFLEFMDECRRDRYYQPM